MLPTSASLDNLAKKESSTSYRVSSSRTFIRKPSGVSGLLDVPSRGGGAKTCTSTEVLNAPRRLFSSGGGPVLDDTSMGPEAIARRPPAPCTVSAFWAATARREIRMFVTELVTGREDIAGFCPKTEQDEDELGRFGLSSWCGGPLVAPAPPVPTTEVTTPPLGPLGPGPVGAA